MNLERTVWSALSLALLIPACGSPQPVAEPATAEALVLTLAKRHTFCLSGVKPADGAKRLRSVLVSPPSYGLQFNNLDCGGQGAEAPAGASSLDPRRFFTSAWARTCTSSCSSN